MKIQYGIVSTNPLLIAQTNSLLAQAREEERKIIGLKVIDPVFKTKLYKVIDPHHPANAERRTDTSAIDEVFKTLPTLVSELKDEKVLLVTSRADLDSVGAMALLTMALNGQLPEEGEQAAMAERVQQINIYDNYTAAPTWHAKSVEEAVYTNKEFGPLNNAVADLKVSLGKRVEMMQK